jgi:hypothetical protein
VRSRPCGSAGLFTGKLNLISDFLQQIVVRAVPFRRLNPKAVRPSTAPICPFSQYRADPAGIPDALPKNRTGKLHRRAPGESLAGG